MAWLLVVVAGMLETGFAVCLKLSHGFTRLWPTIAFCVFARGSFGLLPLSLKKLDVGPAYAAKDLEFCAPGDTVCSGAPPSGSSAPHQQYGVNGMVDQAAAFTVSRLARSPAPV